MLYPTAGCRLFIANAPSDVPGVVPASGWVEIGETEALGMLGVEWSMETFTGMSGCELDDGPEVEVEKGAMRRLPMQIILGDDPSDPGQLILIQAARSRAHYPFRLVFADGVTTRIWTALVIALAEVFDVANGVMKLQADLQPTSAVEGSI